MQKLQENTTGRKPASGGGNRLLTTDEVSEQLRVSVSALTKWRMRDEGPAFVKLGTRVAYTQQALDDYVAAGTRRRSTRAARA